MQTGKRKKFLSNKIDSSVIPEIELHFPKLPGSLEKKLSAEQICMLCHGCCMYVTAPLDPPESTYTQQLYLWYLYHANVEIYQDHEDQWHLLFKTPCENLLPGGQCKIYENRPEICKEYDPSACSRTGKDHKILFKNAKDFLNYLKQARK